VPTVAAFATVVLCVVAGNWQHRRMHEKEALQDDIRRAAAMAPVALPKRADDWRAWRFRQVVASGEYVAERQILIDNKVRAGRVGFDVVTPLRLADGTVVLVDRGWIATGPSRATLPQASPPAGDVTVTGRVDLPSRNYYQLGNGAAPTGPLWEHLDPARFGEATGLPVLPIVIDATDSASTAGLAPDVSLPDTGSERNLSYMVQWYTFAAMAAGLWAWFTLRPRARSDADVRG
jgi:surfeit locus 1 family protein